MNFSIGGVRGSRDDDINDDTRRSAYNRITSAQTAKLQNFMKECDHPNKAQLKQLAEELALEPKQVEVWFQNRRTLLKNQSQKQINNTLRMENERLRSENRLMKETLKVIKCEPCGGPPFPVEEHEEFVRKMQRENAQLKQKLEKMSELHTSFTEGKISRLMLEHALNSLEVKHNS